MSQAMTGGPMARAITGGNMAQTAEALIGLIDVETGMLDERMPERLIETQERKQELIDNYREGVNLIRAGQLSLTPVERDSLKETGKRLEGRMIDHARRIARMKSITEGLIHVVAETAGAKSAPADGYGAHGRKQATTLQRNAYRRPTALSVNRMV